MSYKPMWAELFLCMKCYININIYIYIKAVRFCLSRKSRLFSLNPDFSITITIFGKIKNNVFFFKCPRAGFSVSSYLNKKTNNE